MGGVPTVHIKIHSYDSATEERSCAPTPSTSSGRTASGPRRAPSARGGASRPCGPSAAGRAACTGSSGVAPGSERRGRREGAPGRWRPEGPPLPRRSGIAGEPSQVVLHDGRDLLRGGFDDLELRQAVDEVAAVVLLREPVVEHDHHAGVGLGADEAAEALAEFEHGFRQVKLVEPPLAGLCAGASARVEQGVLPRERQLRDHEAGEGVAGEVLARPQRVDAEQDRLGMGAELIGQSGGAAVYALGQHEDAVVLNVRAHLGGHQVHVAFVGEERQGAAACHCGEALEPLALALGQRIRPPDAVGVVLEHEHRLAAEVEGRGEDALHHVDVRVQAGHVAEVRERAGHRQGGAREHGAAQAVPKRLAHLTRRSQGRLRERPARGVRRAAGAPHPARWTLTQTPLTPARQVREALWDRLRSAVLTSATLTVAGSFAYFRDMTGLDADVDVVERVFPSPFDFSRQAVLVLEHDPDGVWRPDALAQRQGERLKRLAAVTGGRTLALFTNRRDMNLVDAEVGAHVEDDGVLVLAQGVHGSAAALADEFRTHPETILLGVDTLWTGQDFPGDTLTCLVIAKLPFPRQDPLFHARRRACEEAGQRWFDKFYLPEAVLKFRQGFGRLIRTETDTGVVVVLDHRLTQKNYRRDFVDSLPKLEVVEAAPEEIPAVVEHYLRRLAGDA